MLKFYQINLTPKCYEKPIPHKYCNNSDCHEAKQPGIFSCKAKAWMLNCCHHFRFVRMFQDAVTH